MRNVALKLLTLVQLALLLHQGSIAFAASPSVGGNVELDLTGVEVINGKLERTADGDSFNVAIARSTTDQALADPASATIVGITFQPKETTKIHIGVSSSSSTAPLSADIGIRLNDFGNLHVYQGETNMGLMGNYKVDDNIGIYIAKNGQVQVSINNETVFTMTSSKPSFPLHASLTIFSNGATLGIPVWLGKDVWCRKVTCDPSTCQEAGKCVEGTCTKVFAQDGSSCNDNNASTTNDECTKGVCAGVDSCLGVDCGETDDCHGPRRCSFGQCYAGISLQNGTACNDGDDNTARDACDSGICVGVPVTAQPTTPPTGLPTKPPATPAPSTQPTTAPTQPPSTVTVATTTVATAECADVTCPSPDQCHQPNVCSKGNCFVGPTKGEGTVCEDGNDRTTFDRCVQGVCAGVDLCVGKTCKPENDCQSVSNCLRGVCIPVNRSNGANCDDGNAATTSDRCANGVCIGIDTCKDQECQAKSQCHRAGKCIGGTCSNPLQAPGVPCDDGDAATVEDVCAFGVCVGRDACAGVQCEATPCHEAGECLVGECQLGKALADGSKCDDDNAETINDQCNASAACIGEDACADVECEQKVCHTKSSCSQGKCSALELLDDFGDCDDGDASTDNDVCFDGLCKGNKNNCFQVDCPPENSCELEGSCDTATGACVRKSKEDGDVCDDDKNRTKDDICVDGLCVGTDLCLSRSSCTPPACQLRDPQHEGGCLHGICQFVKQEQGTPCDDENSATDDDECTDSGTCVGVDYCIGKVCPNATGECDSVQPCANGVCGSIVFKSNGTSCDDDDETTDFDACTAGKCVGDDLCEGVDCGQEAPCEVRSCSRGNCSTVIKADTTVCDDGNENTVNTTCVSGVCVGIDLCAGVTCAAIDDCHENGTCVKGSCATGAAKPDNTKCDNGKDDVTDVCVVGVCVDVDPCDAVQCPTADACHRATNCTDGKCPPRPIIDGASCDDGDDKTSDDECDAVGECVGIDLCVTQNVTCPDFGLCREGAGCFQGVCRAGTAINVGFPCDDGNDDTDLDSCKNGLCVGIDVCAGVDCGEQTDCFSSTCIDGSCVASPVSDGTTCDDSNKFTDLDVCGNGTCIGINTCAPRECGVPTRQCYVAVCRNASCLEVPRDNGYFCNDLNVATQVDRCVDGECVGTDLCDSITCPSDQCSNPGQCSAGKCAAPIFKANGATCNDNNASTERDFCVDGACNGDSPCADVTCAGETVCATAAQCKLGECIDGTPKADGLVCDDSADNTYADSCDSGVCVGALSCAHVECVAFQDKVALAENLNYGLTRISSTGGWNSGAVSVINLTVGGGVVGGVKFSPASNENSVVVGLGNVGDALGYQTVDHGLLLTSRGDVFVFESGTFTSKLGSYDAGAELSIYLNAENKVVYTLGDGVSSFVSTVLPDVGSILKVEVSIFESGGSVDDFKFLTRQQILCQDVQCRPTPLCHEPVVCVLGECSELTLQTTGTPCNDNNKSTDLDVCRPDGSCVGEDLCIDVSCTDFPYCAEPPTCDRGRCTPCVDACANVTCAAKAECMAAEVCMRGKCLAAENKANGTLCDDGNSVTNVDLCDGEGTCVGLDSCARVGCPKPTQCEDSIACQGDACVRVFKVAGVTCDDGIEATTDDACDGGGRCVGREYCSEKAVQCPLPDQCHLPTECFQGECEYPERGDGTVCDDHDSTTRDDRCVSGQCAGISRCDDIQCSDPTACTPSFACANGTCIAKFSDEGVGCNDNNGDTDQDFCDGTGSCRGHFLEPPSCVVSVRCVGDNCATTYKSQGAPCDDGDNATENDRCDGSGGCAGADNCIGVTCEAKQCYKTSTCFHGECSKEPEDETQSCDDGDRLTNFDQCDGLGECRGVDLCEENGVVCRSRQCETSGRCENGLCVARQQYADQTSCDDDDNTTLYDRCLKGACVGVDLCTDVTCPDAKPCRKDSLCTLGECSVGEAFADGTQCDDSDEQTDDDRCDNGECVGVNLCKSVTCPPVGLHQCLYSDACQSGSCVITQRPSGYQCDDGDSATDNDACDNNGACAGENLCEKFSITCERDQCDEPLACANGVCSVAPPKADGISCDDADSDTVDDVCVQGTCKGTNPCDVVSCPQDACFEQSICQVVEGEAECTRIALESGAGCDDADAETVDDACNAGVCRGIPFTCAGVSDGVIQFSDDACGGFDNTGIEWSTVHQSADCVCFTEFGVAFGEVAGKIKSSTECAQAICEDRELQFVRCNYAGLDVAKGNWSQVQGIDFIQVAYKFRPYVCNVSTTFTTTAVATTAQQQACDLLGVTAHSNAGVDRAIDLDATALAQDASFLSLSVFVGQTLEFTWDKADRVLVQSCECDTCQDVFPKSDLFSTQTSLFDETYKVRFDAPGTYAYRVDVVGVDIVSKYVGSIVVGVAPTTTQGTPGSDDTTAATTADPDSFDLLDSDNHDGGDDAITGPDGVYYAFDGQYALSVRGFPTARSPVSVAMTFRLARGSSGYLFALCNDLGGRYFGLYVSAKSQRLSFYYKVVGSNLQRVVHFNVIVNTGFEYRMLFSVDGTEATVKIASTVTADYTATRQLVGQGDSCQSGDVACFLLVGARSSSGGGIAHGISGNVFTAVYYPTKVGDFPEGTFVAASTTTASPGSCPTTDFNLLTDGKGIAHDGATSLGDGSYSFDGTGHVELTEFPPSVGSEWSVGLWVKQTQGTSGYIFAKTDSSGSRRYFSLYSSGVSKKVSLYYRAAGQRLVSVFNINLSDGILHRVVLKVKGSTAMLIVDTQTVAVTLAAAPLEDCGDRGGGCFFSIGQRMSPSGGAYQFTGTIYFSTPFSPCRSIPRFESDVRVLNMIPSGSQTFSGVGGTALQSFRAIADASFSIAIKATATADSRGYFFAKSNADGTVRHLGLYGNTAGLSFYYKPQGSNSHERLGFAVNAFDGAEHSMLISVNGTKLVFAFDDKPSVTATIKPIDDCGASDTDCVMYVGQRADSVTSGYPFSGEINYAEMYYQTALTQFP